MGFRAPDSIAVSAPRASGFVLHPELAAEIAEHCQLQGDEVNAWIQDALLEALDRDRAQREREEREHAEAGA